MRIAIMGAGGLGSYIGGRMAQVGHDVSFIARGDHLDALINQGLRVKSGYGDFEIKEVTATDDPEEIGPVEAIFFCVKSYDAITAAKMIRPMLANETVIIPVLNGIDHLDILREELGSEHVLGGMAMIIAHLGEAGNIEQIGQLHFIEFGELGTEISDRCVYLEESFLESGIKFKAVENIIQRMWIKLCMVSGFAGVFSVVRGNNAVVSSSPELLNLLREAIEEAITVAQASGIGLSTEFVDEILASQKTAPPQYKPSMLVDLENGKPLELDAIIGVICRLGKHHRVQTPVNNYIYACLKPYANGSPIL